MGRIFVTSDTHFCHDRAFLYEPRGFTSIQEHDEEIIRRWNFTVAPDDTVYHLGDVMLNDNKHGMDCLRQLNGNIIILPGNHDTDARIALYKALDHVQVLESGVPGMRAMSAMIKYNKYNILLSHHPTMTSNLEGSPRLREHLIGLYGHTHQKTKFYQDTPYLFHVGLDAHNCAPVLLDDAIEMMKNKVQECLNML